MRRVQPLPAPAGAHLERRRPGADHASTDELLRLAVSEPQRALDLAEDVLANRPDPLVASFACQAAGIVLRDRGELTGALHQLRNALRLAGTSGTADRVVDVSATYGATLVMAGRTGDGLSQLDSAVALARGALLARVRLRRAHVLSLLGRHREAIEDLRLALRGVRRAGDPLWEAHVLNNRCPVYLALGEVDRAEADACEAERLYGALGHHLEAAQAVHNRGWAAYRRGDLPRALELFDDAGAHYEKLGARDPDLMIDQSRTLLTAGLASDAVAMIDDFLAGRSGVQPVKRAELLHVAALAALAAGSIDSALRRARSARRLFAAQQRALWTARADFVAVQAAYASGRRDLRLQATAARVARRLAAQRCEDAPLAHLLAGRLALETGSRRLAASSLSEAARFRVRGPALQRATGWLAVALEARDAGRGRSLLAACRKGLDALDEHRLTFGGTELRAFATGYGSELAGLALGHVLRRGTARDVLAWSERWRATALRAPPVRPPDDAELARDLAALRDAAVRADEEEGGTSARLGPAQREREHWESEVRRRRMKVAGSGATAGFVDLESLFDSLDETGGAQAVVLVEVDRTLHALVVADHRVRREEVGPLQEALREADLARFSLRAAAHGRRATDLSAMGQQLQRSLLGSAARWLGCRPLVVVPPARLHGVPWGLLPSMAANPVSLSPSLQMWMRAVAAPEPQSREVSLVVGPGLSAAEAEVASLVALHRRTTVLVDADATCARALAGLNGAWLAHVAAHGSFRSDSPLFSSLALEDGPLTVHDLERLEHPPYRIVLSACDVGGGEPVGSDELLGLVTSLLALGTTGVLASVVPVNDEAVVAVMIGVHRELAAGRSLADAWLAARRMAETDPLAAATAASFTAWGV